MVSNVASAITITNGTRVVQNTLHSLRCHLSSFSPAHLLDLTDTHLPVKYTHLRYGTVLRSTDVFDMTIVGVDPNPPPAASPASKRGSKKKPSLSKKDSLRRYARFTSQLLIIAVSL